MKRFNFWGWFFILAILIGLSGCKVGGSSSSSSPSDTKDLRLIGYATKSTVSINSRSVQDVAAFPEADTGASACPDNAGVIWVPPDAEGNAVMQACTGYYYPVNVDTGQIGQLSMFFESTSCSGQPLLIAGNGNSILGLYHLQGIVFTMADGSSLRVAPGQSTSTHTANSSFSPNSGCTPVILTFDGFIVPVANDRSVSGIQGPNVGALTFNSP